MPMIPDLDIYRSANDLVKQHGEDAPVEAAMRPDRLLEAGNLDGYGSAKTSALADKADVRDGIVALPSPNRHWRLSIAAEVCLCGFMQIV